MSEIKVKQQYLNESILYQGFSGDKFAEFVQEKKPNGGLISLGHKQLEYG